MSDPLDAPPPGVDVSPLRNALLMINEMLTPVREAAKGYRAQLEADGWSPTVAEQMATVYLATLTNHCLTLALAT